MNARPPPLSPHIGIYRWYFTMALSILHRGTGIAMAMGLVLLTAWLLAMAAGPASFAVAQDWAGSILGRLVLFGYTAVVFYHAANGLRHLVWDTGRGLDLVSAKQSGRMVLAVAAVLTATVWLIVAVR